MEYYEGVWLWYCGKLSDTKVTIKGIKRATLINIRDRQFRTFTAAMKYLQYIAETEMIIERQYVVTEL